MEVDGCVRFFDVFLLMLVIPPKKKRGGKMLEGLLKSSLRVMRGY